MNKKIIGGVVLLIAGAALGFKLNLISMGAGASGAGGAAGADAAYLLGERPAKIQEEIDASFGRLTAQKKATDKSKWGYKGNVGFYDRARMPMGIDQGILIKDIAQRSKKDIYIMEVGAGYGAWGRAVIQFIQENLKESTKRFHIISITGEDELPNKISYPDPHITLYEFGMFNVENILSTLKQHRLDFTNKIDLIVCKHTLQHLVDPVGTLKQLYSLLTPDDGMLFATGFALYINDQDQNLPNNFDGLWYESASPARYLLFMQRYEHYYAFLLIKRDSRPFEPQLHYQNKLMPTPEYIRGRGHGWAEYATRYTSPIPDDRLTYHSARTDSTQWKKLEDLDHSYAALNVFYRSIEDRKDIQELLKKEWAEGLVVY